MFNHNHDHRLNRLFGNVNYNIQPPLACGPLTMAIKSLEAGATSPEKQKIVTELSAANTRLGNALTNLRSAGNMFVGTPLSNQNHDALLSSVIDNLLFALQSLTISVETMAENTSSNTGSKPKKNGKANKDEPCDCPACKSERGEMPMSYADFRKMVATKLLASATEGAIPPALKKILEAAVGKDKPTTKKEATDRIVGTGRAGSLDYVLSIVDVVNTKKQPLDFNNVIASVPGVVAVAVKKKFAKLILPKGKHCIHVMTYTSPAADGAKLGFVYAVSTGDGNVCSLSPKKTAKSFEFAVKEFETQMDCSLSRLPGQTVDNSLNKQNVTGALEKLNSLNKQSVLGTLEKLTENIPTMKDVVKAMSNQLREDITRPNGYLEAMKKQFAEEAVSKSGPGPGPGLGQPTPKEGAVKMNTEEAAKEPAKPAAEFDPMIPVIIYHAGGKFFNKDGDFASNVMRENLPKSTVDSDTLVENEEREAGHYMTLNDGINREGGLHILNFLPVRLAG